jgi:putative mRNA 3-end processing factor
MAVAGAADAALGDPDRAQEVAARLADGGTEPLAVLSVVPQTDHALALLIRLGADEDALRWLAAAAGREARADRIEAELAGAQGEARARTAEAAELRDQLATLRRAERQARREAQEAGRRRQAKDASLSSAERERLARAEARSAELEVDRAALVDELAEARARLDAERERLGTDLGRAGARVAELERLLAEAQATIDGFDDVDVLTTRYAEVLGRLAAGAAARLAAGTTGPADDALFAFLGAFAEFRRVAGEVRDAGAAPAQAPARPVAEAPLAPAVPRTPAGRSIRRRGAGPRPGWTVRSLDATGPRNASAIVATTRSGEVVLLDAGRHLDDTLPPFADLAGTRLRAVVVTHAHADHAAGLPALMLTDAVRRAEPTVFMSEPTRELARPNLVGRAAAAQRGGARALATPAEVSAILSAVEVPPPYAEVPIPRSSITLQLLPVAHVLGSCAVRLIDHASGESLLYTGDLGPLTGSPTLPDFAGTGRMEPAGLVVMEATNGRAQRARGAAPEGRDFRGRTRNQQVVDRLLEACVATLGGGGSALLPATALGHTQDLVRLLGDADALPAGVGIVVGDKGDRILDIYRRYAASPAPFRWLLEGGFPAVEALAPLREGYEHDAAEAVLRAGPACLVVGPADLAGGWSRQLLREVAHDPAHLVALTGTLPPGATPDAPLGDAWREPLAARLQVAGLGMHAPAEDLRRFARELAERGDGTHFAFFHGNHDAQASLAADVARMPGVRAAEPLTSAAEFPSPRLVA